MKKIANVFLTVFSVGVVCALFAGGLAAVGYVVALFVGGETATSLCVWIYKTYFPFIIKLTSVFVGFGLIGMYFSKQKALTAATDTDKKEEK